MFFCNILGFQAEGDLVNGDQVVSVEVNVAEDLESDKIQAQLKELLPTYQPRSFTPVTKEDHLNPYAIKGEA